MDEMTDIKQPLLGDYNEKEKLQQQGDGLPAPGSAPPQLPAKRNWRAAVIRTLLAWTAVSLVVTYVPNPFIVFLGQYDPMRPYEALLASHRSGDLSTLSCEQVAFEEGASSVDAPWIELGRDYFDGPTATVSYGLTLKASELKVFTKGPIVGNVTLTSGDTKSDDVVEVEIEFKKPGCKKHKHKHGDHKPEHGELSTLGVELPGDFEGMEDEDSEEGSLELDVTKDKFWTRAWSSPFGGSRDHDGEHHPHRPRGPPKVKVCPLYTDEGHIRGVGIIAYHHEHGHERPHPPPPPPPSSQHHPHPPHHPGPPRRGPWKHGHHGHPALAHITIRFPTPKEASPIVVENFKTVLPGFKHVVYDLAVSFTKLELITVGRPVFVKHVSASFLKIVSVKGPIFGRFTISKLLELVSVGKPIAAKVDLYGASDDRLFNASLFSAFTTNAWIAANISLHSLSDEPLHFPASYVVKTVSSGGYTWKNHTHSGTFLKIAEQPTNSTLVVDATARFAPLVVSVPSSFQGLFELTSLFSKPVLAVNEDAKDPTGEDRKREVKLFKTWGAFRIKGLVKWVKEGLQAKVGGCLGHIKPEEGGVTEDDEGKKQAWGKIKLFSVKKPAKLALA